VENAIRSTTYSARATGQMGQLSVDFAPYESTTCETVRDTLRQVSRLATDEPTSGTLGVSTTVRKYSLSSCGGTSTIAREPPTACVFSPSDGQVPPHRERSRLEAFAFSGRCFVERVAQWPERRSGGCILGKTTTNNDRRSQVRILPRSTKHRLSSGRALTQQMGECRRRTQKSDSALSAPALVGLVTGTDTNRQRKTMHVWSPIEDAWKSNVDPLGAVALASVVQGKWWPNGTWDASGLRHL
jgi:hypothetical protein